MIADMRTQYGQAWLLLLIGLLLGSMAGLLAHTLALSPQNQAYQQAQRSLQSLQSAREALLGYAVTYRETHPDEGYGYLPCPDMNGNGEATATCGATGTFALGLLPYKTLGLPDLRDGSGECLWYAVSGRFKNNPKSALLNWDAQGELDISDAGGQNFLRATNDMRGGTAAIVFAPGPPLGEQSSGRTATAYPCLANPQQAARYLESTRPPFRQGTAPAINDQLTWLTNADIFARLRQRKDFAAYINHGMRSLQSALGFNQIRYPPASGARLPDTVTSLLPTRDTRFHAQWHDQFAYLACATGGSHCYTLANQACDGALIFSGEHVDGRPRTMAERGYADYFESALGLVTGIDKHMPQLVANYMTTSSVTRSRDIVRCLSPRTQTLSSAALEQIPVAVGDLATAAAIDGNTPWLRLGRTDIASLSAGCAWFPEPLLLGAGDTTTHLRLYFTFTITAANQGFTLALADADANTGNHMCGKGGAWLGYAGTAAGVAPINAPKIALEFDTQCSGATFGETPCTVPWQQLAFVYWGKDDGLNDDNKHGSGNNPPLGSSAERHPLSFVGTLQHVRFEMERHYEAGSGVSHHVLRAWLSDDPSLCHELWNLSEAMSTLRVRNPDCPAPTISSALDIPRSANGGVPFKQAWLGFTAGQEGNVQSILIHQLLAEVSVQ